MPVPRMCFRLILSGAALVFLSARTQASVLDYNSSCTVSLSWVGPGTLPPVTYSGTGSGSNSGCSFTGSTINANLTASASDVSASVLGSVLTLSNSNSVPIHDDDNVPIGGSGSDLLYGSMDAGVMGSFTGTYELTGPNIANDMVLIQFAKNAPPLNCHTFGGGCITVEVSQNGNPVTDFSQPFQLSIQFEEDVTSACCALDTGGSLNAAVNFEVSDANGNAVSANLAEVPEPGSFALAWTGIGLLALGLIRRRATTL
jgi:hypothetical protein